MAKHDIPTSFQQAHRKSDDLLFKKDPRSPNLSVWTIGTILISSQLGTWAFKFREDMQKGLFYCLTLLAIVYVLNILSFFLYIKTWIYGQCYSYRTVWEYAIHYGPWIADFFILVSSFNFSMYAFGDLYDLFVQIVLSFEKNPPPFLVNKGFVTYCITSILSLFICFVREIHNFWIHSYVGIFCYCVLIIIFIYNFIRVLTNGSFDISPNTKWFDISPFDFFVSLSVYCGLYSEIQSSEHIIQVMHRPTYRRFTLTYCVSTGIGAIVHATLMIIANLLLTPNTPTSMILMFDQNEASIKVARYFLYFFIIISMNCQMWLVSRHLLQMFAGSIELTKWTSVHSVPNFFSGLAVIFLNAMCHFGSETAIFYTEYCNVGVPIMVFVIPSIYYMKMFSMKGNAPWYICAIVLLVIGIGLVIFFLYQHSAEIKHL